MKSIFALTALLTFSAHAQNKHVVLSGGGAPWGNHYSQYLQTNTISTHLLRNVSPATDIFFGAGNAPNRRVTLADVHRSVTTETGKRSIMLPGTIERNRPATKKEFMSYARQELPRLTNPQGTLFMMISDHGMPNLKADGSADTSFQNNCIDMWSVVEESQGLRELPWNERCLSRAELQDVLSTNSRASRNVFVMSQCFSGGFHRMSVSVTASGITADPRICGFTAITEDTTASGCTPDVDGPGYQGYERFMTQQMTGKDVVTGRTIGQARASLREAHEAATLEDLTVDIPISTSEFYLEQWAKVFAAASHPQNRAFREAFTNPSLESDADFRRRRIFVQAMGRVLGQLSPQTASVVQFGTREQLSAVMDSIQREAAQLARETNPLYVRSIQLQNKILVPAWQQEVLQPTTSGLTAQERQFESGFLLGWDRAGITSEMSITLMALNTPVNPQVSEAFSIYAGQRSKRRLEWALKNPDAQLRQAAAEIQRLDQEIDRLSDRSLELQKSYGLHRRMKYYREALAAWQVLSNAKQEKAMKDLNGLVECEKAVLR